MLPAGGFFDGRGAMVQAGLPQPALNRLHPSFIDVAV